MAREVAGTRKPIGQSPGTANKPSTPEKPSSHDKVSVLENRNAIRPISLVPHRLTAAERHRRICDLAYRRAEQRGFAPDGAVDDWLEAEREVDAGRY